MTKKFFAVLTVCAFAFASVGAVFAAPTDTKKPVVKKQANNALAARLPASDAVMTVDVKRLFADALPQILAGNQPMLADITDFINEMKNKTGFDLRQFEQVAVGVATTKTESGELDFQPVIFARGAFNSGALIAIGKTAANGKYREEKSGARSIFIFSPSQFLVQKPASSDAPQEKKRTPSVFERAADRMFENLSREVAVTALDDNTLAIGTLARVRASLNAASPRVGADVLSLINRRPNAIAAFGLKLPEGVSNIIPDLGNDEIAKNLNAIRSLAGAFDANDGNTSMSISARTAQTEQAKSLEDQLLGLQSLGKMFVGGAKDARKEVFSRLIDRVKIARAANEVTLDLQIPQSDISVLLNKKK